MAGTFKIGLTMAGAISGGAYTAGVLDFLFEALAEWEKAKKDPALQKSWLDQKTKEQEEDHAKAVQKALAQSLPAPAAPPPIVFPDHNVVVPVIVGASAGTICANLLPVALALGREPGSYTNMLASDAPKVKAFLPTLYEAWVEWPNFVSNAANKTFGDFMDNKDLDEDKKNPDGDKDWKIVSALNTKILDDIAVAAVNQAPGAVRVKSPNVPDKLHVYATLGNLRGVPYKIDFPGGNGQKTAHGMRLHADRAHIVFKNVGSSKEYAGRYAELDKTDLTVDAEKLPVGLDARQIFDFDAAQTDNNWGKFLAITLGSSAFPGALRTRRIAPELASYDDRSWPLDINEIQNRTAKVQAAWSSEADPNLDALLGQGPAQSTYEYRAVDGGVFDNEPFQITRYSLFENPETDRQNKWEKGIADRAVLMIDPFPEPPSVDPRAWKPEDDLLKALLGFPTALINQARFKAEELIKALDEKYASRFLMAPIRIADGSSSPERIGLACGLLGGFGGFLDIKLRQHDFLLGRRNCQAFLKKHLMLPKSNSVMAGKGMADPEGDVPVIPLVGSAIDDIPLPPWPNVQVQRVQEFAEACAKRGEKIFDRLTRNLPTVKGWLARQADWLFFGVGTMIGRAVFQVVIADLLRRNCLDFSRSNSLKKLSQKPPSTRELLLLAAFCDKSEDKRSAKEIAKAIGLIKDGSDPTTIQRALSDLEAVAKTYDDFVAASGSGDNREYRPLLRFVK